MNNMHFDGTILKADLHSNPAPQESFLELRIIIDVEEEIMMDVSGSKTQLDEKFELDPGSFESGNIHLIGKKCKILRNAAGYHFMGMIK